MLLGTQYLGPLQQARWTFGDWGFDKSSFTVDVAGLTLIKGTGQNVTLTLEVRSIPN
jgi:endoglucanase